MAGSPKKGVLLLSNGSKMESKTIAKLCGETEQTINNLISELETAGVFSRLDTQEIYSRKMYRDYQISEARKEAGRIGGSKQKVSKSASKTEAPLEIPSFAVASSLALTTETKENANTLFSTPEPKPKSRKKENHLSPDELEKHLLNFDLFWKAYPKRDGKKLGKKKAKQIWVKTITPEEAGLVISATGCYAKSKGARDGYAMDATRFLNEEIWRDIETGEQENDNKEGVYL
jgi:hypothetical protein